MDPTFKEHVKLHYKRLYCFALSLSKNDADAADLTQQAYLKLAKNWEKIRDKSKVKSWLFSTLYREFLDKKRHNQRAQSISTEIANYTMANNNSYHPNKLDTEVALKSLMRLDDTLRLPLTLFYLEDYSYREIGEILTIPIGTVMSRLHRGKQILHDQLTTELKQALA